MANEQLEQIAESVRFMDSEIGKVKQMIRVLRNAGEDTSAVVMKLNPAIFKTEKLRDSLAKEGIKIPKTYVD